MTDRIAIALTFYNDKFWTPSLTDEEERMVEAIRAAARVQSRAAYITAGPR